MNQNISLFMGGKPVRDYVLLSAVGQSRLKIGSKFAIINIMFILCYKHVIMLFSIIRCKENHPTPKLSPEDVDAIAEIEDSIKDRANAFSEMEAFLPKKNGFDSVILRLIVCIWIKGDFHNKVCYKVCLYGLTL